jgi:tRNA A-37 threonylcarbamoyl transferase component Bud32
MFGEVIKGFEVIRRLGKGGMGEVWVAEQQIIKTKVAIKFLLPELSHDQELVSRFFNEAIAVSRIKHAGIVKIADVGFHKGAAFLIMELLEGEPLGARIRRVGRFSLEEVRDIGWQLASVLGATHAAGITHRDLKPDNIFVVPDDELSCGERVKILDFGLAKLGSAVGITGSGTTMGTPSHMAPELWRDAASAAAPADVYAVGCILFEMCCGRPPFVVSSIAEAYAKHVHEAPPRARALAPEVPAELDDVIARALAKQPAGRPTPAELQQVLAALSVAQPTGRRRARPLRRIALGGVAVIALTVTVLGAARYSIRGSEGRPLPPPGPGDARLPDAVAEQARPAIDAPPLVPDSMHPPMLANEIVIRGRVRMQARPVNRGEYAQFVASAGPEVQRSAAVLPTDGDSSPEDPAMIPTFEQAAAFCAVLGAHLPDPSECKQVRTLSHSALWRWGAKDASTGLVFICNGRRTPLFEEPDAQLKNIGLQCVMR